MTISYIHFKDVLHTLSKFIIEAKHADGNDLKYNSELIETMLNDRWIGQYPSRLNLPSAQHVSRIPAKAIDPER